MRLMTSPPLANSRTMTKTSMARPGLASSSGSAVSNESKILIVCGAPRSRVMISTSLAMSARSSGLLKIFLLITCARAGRRGARRRTAERCVGERRRRRLPAGPARARKGARACVRACCLVVAQEGPLELPRTLTAHACPSLSVPRKTCEKPPEPISVFLSKTTRAPHEPTGEGRNGVEREGSK